jgi:adenylate kinase family enzyme
MQIAIKLYGPSGVGKSTLGGMICKKYDYKHINAAEFKRIFSVKRSRIRTDIGEKMACLYAKELILRGFSIVIEDIPDEYYLKPLKRLLKERRYKLIEISLVAPVEQCVRNDRKRGINAYGEEAIREVYPKYLIRAGYVIDVTDKSKKEVFRLADRCIKQMKRSRCH